jgi:hypothetical protein
MSGTGCPAWTLTSTGMQDTTPDRGKDAEARGMGGEASAQASNGWRVNAAPKSSVVKALQGWLSLAHQKADDKETGVLGFQDCRYTG